MSEAKIVSITKNTIPYSIQEIEASAATLMQEAQLYFTIGAALFGFTELMRRKELNLRDVQSLKAAMAFVQANAGMPKKKAESEGPRFFNPRKTVAQLAHEYRERLEALGLFASIEDITEVIRSKSDPNVVTTVVSGWIEDEKRKGTVIIDPEDK